MFEPQQAPSQSSGRAMPAMPDLSDDEFARIARRVLKTTGIVLKDHKRVLVKSRISKRLKELGMDQFATYLDYLDTPDGEAETIAFCNAITTNLTSFFREEHHFEHMCQQLQQMDLKPDSRLRIWSAGCSTGNEPYSIAMSLMSCSCAAKVANKKILATDIDTAVLDTAAKGIYRENTRESVPEKYRHFLVEAGDEKHVRVAEPLRDLVAFRRLNLFDEWPFRGQFDFIFCRNVMIYFSKENKEQLIDNFANYLRPGGVLYVGHSETLMRSHPKLVAESRTAFRRV